MLTKIHNIILQFFVTTSIFVLLLTSLAGCTIPKTTFWNSNQIIRAEDASDPDTETIEESETNTKPADYKINVSTNYQGSPIEGIEIKLSGNSINKSLTTTLSGADEFTGLTAGTYTVSIVFPPEADYQLPQGISGSTNVTLSETNQSEKVVFSLAAKEPEKDENLEKIQSIKLPEKLTKIGSTTTIISKIPEDKLESVSDFTFDNPGTNKIVFQESLDLSNYEDYSKISLIGDYIDLETIGKVSFDADLLPPFNKKAKIVMSQIKLVDIGDEKIAEITRDGEVIDVKDINYKKTNEELSFVVDSFSTYALQPRIKIDFSDLEGNRNED
ncbi:hypothetical protein GF389_05355, partial [Candidatus Dojkabacteria bacterium]|nr:hypothetical protein [Candidatus Dojkabacteria bacterium]